MTESESALFWWIVPFLVLALGNGAAVVFLISGSLISGAAAFLLFF